jgi:hypothetical protein
MTPVSADRNHTSFELIEDKISKDQVSFVVHSGTDQNEVSLKVFPSRIEVRFIPSLDDKRQFSVREVCNNVRLVIELAIPRCLKNLHYKEGNINPMMCLRCEHCSKLHKVKEGVPCKMYCKKANWNFCIPSQGKFWFNEGQYCFRLEVFLQPVILNFLQSLRVLQSLAVIPFH